MFPEPVGDLFAAAPGVKRYPVWQNVVLVHEPDRATRNLHRVGCVHYDLLDDSQPVYDRPGGFVTAACRHVHADGFRLASLLLQFRPMVPIGCHVQPFHWEQ